MAGNMADVTCARVEEYWAQGLTAPDTQSALYVHNFDGAGDIAADFPLDLFGDVTVSLTKGIIQGRLAVREIARRGSAIVDLAMGAQAKLGSTEWLIEDAAAQGHGALLRALESRMQQRAGQSEFWAFPIAALAHVENSPVIFPARVAHL